MASSDRRYVGKEISGWRRARKWIRNTTQITTADMHPSTKCISRIPFSFWPSNAQLPRRKARRYHRHGEARSQQQIEVRRRGQAPALGPLRDKVERHGHHKQRDRKMNQHHMLRVFGQYNGFEVERIYTH